MNENDKEKLEIYCRQKLKENYDKFDFESHIDSTLTYYENVTIINEKIEMFLDTPLTKEDIKQYEAEEQKYLSQQKQSIDKVLKLFLKPKIIGICADPNEGKSNLIYYLIKELQRGYTFELYSYGLRLNLGEQKIYSIEELEKVRNGVIFLDEMFTLLDLEDRKKRRAIEATLRLLFHNNNVLVLCGLPDNFKKYISSKLDVMIYKKCTLSNFINGSEIKNNALNYKGQELGSTVLNIDKDKAIIYDGEHYSHIDCPYLPVYDTKKQNVQIIVQKSVQQNVVKK